jgi:hypothetical protein
MPVVSLPRSAGRTSSSARPRLTERLGRTQNRVVPGPRGFKSRPASFNRRVFVRRVPADAEEDEQDCRRTSGLDELARFGHDRRVEAPAAAVRPLRCLPTGAGRDARGSTRQVHPDARRRSDHQILGRQPPCRGSTRDSLAAARRRRAGPAPDVTGSARFGDDLPDPRKQILRKRREMVAVAHRPKAMDDRVATSREAASAQLVPPCIFERTGPGPPARKASAARA